MYSVATKLAIVTGLMLAGSTLFASCGWTDIRKNVVMGGLDFVHAYSESVLSGLAPTPPDVFPGDWSTKMR